MHNLTAMSLGLPGTPLHGLDDFEPRSRPAAAPLSAGLASHCGPTARARPHQPRATRGRRFAARALRAAPN